jgi:hypothetical protein
MATDIGSLAPGLDGHVVRLGINARGYEKHGGRQLFLGASLSIVDSPVMSTVENRQLFAHFLSTLPLMPFAPLSSFPLLHFIPLVITLD